MFPGFVYIYKDINGFVHLFFFKGINEDDKHIYRDLDLSKIPFEYTESIINDLTIDYKFKNKSIIKITCNLVPIDLNKQIEKKVLAIHK